jgi:2-dehydropantoate 2-reductase
MSNREIISEGWPSIAVVGAGAVGCYFGGMLARAGAPVTLIGRQLHMDAIAREGLYLDGLRVRQRIPIRTSTDIEAASSAQVILFCVKTIDTETVARAMQPHLAPDSTVLSLQNGVDNVERIQAAAGIRAIPAVVYVAAAMVAPGHVKHSGRGDLILGRAQQVGEAEDLAPMFERAEVPCRVSASIDADLWAKMIMNCAYNAFSALTRARYGHIVHTPYMRDLMRRVVVETVEVACAAGVPIEESGMVEDAYRLGEAMFGAMSSTAQDIARAKHTEIDSLNGYIVRRGAELGVDTPVNQTLHALVKMLEQSSREEQSVAAP